MSVPAGPTARTADATTMVRAGDAGEAPVTVGPPLQRGSTVLLKAADLYSDRRPTYGMNALAPHAALRSALATLEHAEGVTLYSSGLAAVTGPILALVSAGDEVLAMDNVYGPTRRFCDKTLSRLGVGVRYLPADADAEALGAAIGPATRLLVLETPGSLTFETPDVAALAVAARARNVLTLVDNTWAAGVLFRPLDHGCDVAVQALTKYVGGHSDVFLGSAAWRDPAVGTRLDAEARNFGESVSPDDAWMALRGLRTLMLRLERHGAGGIEVASWLARQPEVARVLHPALPGDPGHALYTRDFEGACGLFGAELKPVTAAAVDAFLDTLRLFGLGFSWGGYESLAIACDAQLTRTAKPWRSDGPLIRLHVGLEDPADLIADLRRGLDHLSPLSESSR